MSRKPAASQRAKRLSDVIQRELSMLFLQASSDVREPGLTITSVDVTRDLSRATVWVTQLNGDPQAIEKELNKQSGYWRKALAPALSTLHKMPELHFKYDLSLERSLHINNLIAQAMAQTKASETSNKDAAASENQSTTQIEGESTSHHGQ